MNDKKTFLLIMPDYSDFPELFRQNLEKLGYKVFVITDKNENFRYQGLERFINFFRKTFLRDKSYKKNLVEIHKLKGYNNYIHNIGTKLDYTLVIRPDLFPVSFIKDLKSYTSKLIAYQWDGINKFPEIKNYFTLFDTFFCFDKVEDQPQIRQITNFYFDTYPAKYKPYDNANPILYFVGTFWKNEREERINKFIQHVSKMKVTFEIYIHSLQKIETKNKHITYIENRISFAENLQNVQNVDVLLDFTDPNQSGLSIRFFEGLYYRKKVITDNTTVKNYDFYHPDNIFVLENDNYEDLRVFLKIPYHNMPDNIVEKYSFSTWLQKIITD